MILLKCKKESLLAPLQSVSGIVERRHTLPILSNVLLERKGDELTYLATDIEIQITTTAKVDGGSDNLAVTVSAKKLQDILRSLPDAADVSLELKEKRLQLDAGKSRFILQTLPAEDFPRLANNTPVLSEITLPQKDLRLLLSNTLFAMAVQDVRYYLNGLLLIIEGQKLIAVATDGHRLAYYSSKMLASVDKVETILPRKTVLELNRLLADTDEPVNIKFYESKVAFEFANLHIVSKIIDGKFPDYDRVIPKTFSNDILIDRQMLLNSLNRVAILTNEKFRGVRVMFNSNKLNVTALNSEQETAEEEIDIEYAGQALDIGFNINYLLEVLNNIHDEKIKWSFNDSNSSSLVSTVGDDDFKYVVMPMRI